MLPTTKASERASRDPCMISDSWYFGAFGRWWRGGYFEAWYQDVMAGPKDEESWTSGILNMKRLDMLQDYKGMHYDNSSFTTLKPSPASADIQR
jgi:epidermal growth factor receptor substrate 15